MQPALKDQTDTLSRRIGTPGFKDRAQSGERIIIANFAKCARCIMARCIIATWGRCAHVIPRVTPTHSPRIKDWRGHHEIKAKDQLNKFTEQL